MSQIHNELRKEFQIERMILFTDAVFAIAITLLIIEIKAPEIHHGMTRLQKIDQLLNLIGKFIGFIISFFVVGIYWVSHHRLFGFVKNYNNKLIWLNMMFLFTIVLMPFSSAYYSENYGEKLPFAFYCFNVMATGMANYLLANYLIRNNETLTEGLSLPRLHKLLRARTLMVPLAFFISFLISRFLPSTIAAYGPLLIIPGMRWIRWKYGRFEVESPESGVGSLESKTHSTKSKVKKT